MRCRARAFLLVPLVVAALVVASPTAVPAAADGNEAPAAPLLNRSLTAGDQHSCARLGDGSVKCWGFVTGTGITGPLIGHHGDGPNEMGANLLTVDLGTGRTATALVAGRDDTCALLDNATVKCWGLNNTGQLGQGDTTTRDTGNVAAIALGTGRTATAVTAGATHTCALLDNATVKCWGGNTRGQLGQGDSASRGDNGGEMGDNLAPVALGAGRTATAITAGESHTCALLDNGTVKCWGENDNGQLGLGDNVHRGDDGGEMGDSLPAVDLGTGRTATAISAGDEHTCALLDDATVKCWGENSLGQVGLGATNDRGDGPGEMGDALFAVLLGAGRTATALSAGAEHSCALLDNATVKCWGANASGQLGQGGTAPVGDEPNETGDNLAAINLGTGRTALSITAGGAHTCAVRDDLRLQCWGENGRGQLGLGDAADRGNEPGEMGDSLSTIALTGNGISGTVTDAVSSSAVIRGFVAVLDADDFSYAATAYTASDGRYSVAVPAGGYYLYLFDSLGEYTAGFHGPPTLVTVASGLTAANPMLAPMYGQITGTISDATTTDPIDGAWVVVMNASGIPEAFQTVGGGGAFAIGGLAPGTHYVASVDPTGAHHTRFHPNSANLPASTPASVTAGGSTVSNGSLPLQSPGTPTTTITGTVTDGNAAPVADLRVLAIRTSDFTTARGTLTAANGTYSLSVPAGSYYVAFLTGQTQWYDGQPATGLGSATAVTAPATNINASIPATTGTISGTVAATPQTSAAGVWILALGTDGISRTARGDSIIHGAYGLTVNAGTYRLAVLNPVSGRLEYWQDSATYGGATAIPVAGGATVTINPNLASPP